MCKTILFAVKLAANISTIFGPLATHTQWKRDRDRDAMVATATATVAAATTAIAAGFASV